MYGFLIGKSNCPISLYRTHPIWGRSPYISYEVGLQTTPFGLKLTAESWRLVIHFFLCKKILRAK